MKKIKSILLVGLVVAPLMAPLSYSAASIPSASEDKRIEEIEVDGQVYQAPTGTTNAELSEMKVYDIGDEIQWDSNKISNGGQEVLIKDESGKYSVMGIEEVGSPANGRSITIDYEMSTGTHTYKIYWTTNLYSEFYVKFYKSSSSSKPVIKNAWGSDYTCVACSVSSETFDWSSSKATQTIKWNYMSDVGAGKRVMEAYGYGTGFRTKVS